MQEFLYALPDTFTKHLLYIINFLCNINHKFKYLSKYLFLKFLIELLQECIYH